MDPTEIEHLVQELSLSNEAKSSTVILSERTVQQSEERLKKCVVGKIYTSKAVNRETLLTQVPKIIQSRGSTSIEIIGENVFIVEFDVQTDKKRCLEEGPWNFFNSFMAFKEPTDVTHVGEVEFSDLLVWVQLHNLPIVCVHESAIHEIGSLVGEVIEVDVGIDGRCFGKFARVRVRRPIDKPLQRCVMTALNKEGEKHMILLKYERLPDFCYKCGRIGHVMRECMVVIYLGKPLPYGTWLKAGRVEFSGGRSEGGRG